ncbi:MAG: MmpS family transport accessory protein [Anaerolineaceae bacterium]
MVKASNRRRSRLLFDVLILVIVIAIIFGVFLYLGAFEKPEQTTHELTYQVKGSSAVAVITYTREDGTTSQAEEYSIPWHLTINAKKSLIVVLTAGNPSQAGTIECKLILDGREWKSETASAPNDKVSCAGLVP